MSPRKKMSQQESNDYALQKTAEYFDSLTWEDIRQYAELDTEDGIKVAMVIAEVGDQLEEKMGITPKKWGKMLLAAGAAISAALKDKEEHDTSKWN